MDYVALIREVEKRSELYDKASYGYFNRPAHEMAWIEIGQVVGATAADAKKEWTYLRNKFQKWKAKPASSYWKPTSKKTLGIAEQYAEHLEFLTEHMSTSQGPNGNLGGVTTLKQSEVENVFDGTVSDSSNDDVSVASWQSSSPNCQLPPNCHARPPKIHPSMEKFDCIYTPPNSSGGMYKKRSRSGYLERVDISGSEHPDIGWFRSLLPVIEKLPEEQKLLWKTEVQILLSKYIGAKKMTAQTSHSNCFMSFGGSLATDDTNKNH